MHRVQIGLIFPDVVFRILFSIVLSLGDDLAEHTLNASAAFHTCML